MTETAVLAAVGGVVGLSIACASAQVFHTMAASVPRVDELRIGWRIVLYSIVSALGVTLLCGLLPAIRSTRREPTRL
jgi:ABC-type antimicrobial peptide transport system permease subunit